MKRAMAIKKLNRRMDYHGEFHLANKKLKINR